MPAGCRPVTTTQAKIADLENSTKLLFVETCRVIHSRALSEKEKWIFEGEVNEFEQYLAVILGIKDTMIKYAALRVVYIALQIGYYHPGNATVTSELCNSIRNELATSRNKKKKVGEINDIIYSEANRVLKLQDHTGWTLAVSILYTVIKRINKLDPPEEWRVRDPEKLTKEEKRRVRENIRGRIRRNPDLVSLLECNTRPIVNS
jgi:hypothetical protein